ncbi:cell surface protein [Xylariales sp. PMI_506]|nr:cell surface protein [Xylariales sp. PMI_506]
MVQIDGTGRPWVVMPLYIYPLTETTWKPLYDAIANNPEVNFLVVVNPNSGPGGAPLPGRDYEREVPRLNAFANVRTVGYVKIDYCKRPLGESCGDVELYAGWGRDHHQSGSIPGMYVEGIYVDETPNHYAEEREHYLKHLHEYIREADGLLSPRMIIHNPGTPTEGDLTAFGNPDLVCLCEEPYELYCGDNVQKRLVEFHQARDRCIYQISGIPQSEIDQAVSELCQRGQYVFATDLVDDFYESFGPSWESFVAAVKAS